MKLKPILTGLVCASLLSGCTSSNLIAKYPKMEKYSEDNYEKWLKSREELKEQYDGYNEGMNGYYSQLNEAFFAEEENRTISPLNIYMALSICASMSEGETQAQILSILNVTKEDLEKKAHALWEANYVDDGIVTSKLNNSLWLNQDVSYKEEKLKKISEAYYASIFTGEMGSQKYDQELQTWMNENTGNLLSDSIDQIHMEPEEFMRLVSTIYYNGKWMHTFDEADNTKAVFHGLQDQETTFMHQTLLTSYVDNDLYTAVSLPINNSGSFWIVLPKKDLASVWKSERVDAGEMIEVHLSMPKFDIQNTLSIKETLQKLGMVDAFEPSKADFSPIADQAVYVSDVEHGVRVKVDEQGIEAAAYTMFEMEMMALIEEELDFVVDRPFIFALVSEDGSLLFSGQVYEVEDGQ